MVSENLRRLRYLFERQMLPSLVFTAKDLARSLDLFGATTLPFLWADAVEETGIPVRKAPAAPRWAPPVEVAGYRVGVITMPRPTAMGDAHMIAIAARSAASGKKGQGAGNRYFTLELNDIEAGAPKTMLCEWTSEGVHCNYGDGPQAEVKAFLHAVSDELRAAAPASLVPMSLPIGAPSRSRSSGSRQPARSPRSRKAGSSASGRRKTTRRGNPGRRTQR